MSDERDVDGQIVNRLHESVKIVRGIEYFDGKPYRRWCVATKQGNTWCNYDSAKIIDSVDAILSFGNLDVFAESVSQLRTLREKP